MISEIYGGYKFLKEITKDTREALTGFKSEITFMPGDRWIAERNRILDPFLFSDPYLSIAYVKGTDGISRYWSCNSSAAAKEYESKTRAMIRRIIILEDGLDLNSMLLGDDGNQETTQDWLLQQRFSGVDIWLTDSATVLGGLEPDDVIKQFTADSIRSLAKRQKIESKIDQEIWDQLKRPDACIMDIGIYGMSGVGFQITDDLGQPLGFILSKRDSDIIEARKYFNLVCVHAKRPEWQATWMSSAKEELCS